MNLSAAILVGGESRRMARDKALVDFGGRPMLVHVADRLRTISEDVFVVGKDVKRFEALRLRAVTDASADRSPLIGVVTALRAATCGSVFVCACDMPFVDEGIIGLLARRVEGHDAAVPVHRGRVESLHAVWATAAVDRIESLIGDGVRAVHEALDQLAVAFVEETDWRALDADGRSFTNVNTADDLAHAVDSL